MALMNGYDPFGTSIYDHCITEGCKNETQHRSGLCLKCRTRVCYVCGDEFIASKNLQVVQPRCGMCKIKNKRPKA